jgi:pSer/pThr/pTyr-binding forkhead associated (FHA) protein
VLDDPSVSSRHARIVVDRPGHGILEDQGSTNGVAVGDVTNRVQRAEVTTGDRIFFGTVAVPAENLVGHRVNSAKAAPAVAPASPGSPLRNVAIGIAACVVLTALGGSVLLMRKTASSEPNTAGSATVSHASDPVPQPPLPNDRPKAQAASPVKAAPDFHSIAEHARPALVWLGLKYKNYLFPLASAWAVKPTVLVSTAAAVTELEKMSRKPDQQIFAWVNGLPISARSFSFDPKYSTSDPTSEESIRHNVGIVRIVSPITTTLRVAPQDTVRTLGPTTPLVAAGFFSTSAQDDPYDRLKQRFEHAMLTLRSTEDDRPGAAPVFIVELPFPNGQSSGRWLDGAPIIAGDETVVGLLSTGSARIRMIPVDDSLWKNDP